MSYREHAPPARLAGWIDCLWTIRVPADGQPRPTAVLPDNCMDAIFDLGACARGAPSARAYAVGTMRAAKTYQLPPGADLTGVRLRPGAGRAFLDGDPADLVDRIVPLDRIWGREADLVEESLRSAPSAARPAMLARILERRAAPDRTDPLVREAAGLAERTRGRISVASLARALGRSERTLERRFADATGVGPKEMARVIRFRHALRVLRADPDLGGARLAARCGYADQSHLIREFRALAGATPTEVLPTS